MMNTANQKKPQHSKMSNAVQSSVSNMGKTVIQTVQRSGPIPTPEEMQSYQGIDPSFPDRIMKMAENEQKGQYDLRKSIIDSNDQKDRLDASNDRLALWFCFLLCVLFVVSAVVLFVYNKNLAGSLFTAVAFIAIPKYFLNTWNFRKGGDKPKK